MSQQTAARRGLKGRFAAAGSGRGPGFVAALAGSAAIAAAGVSALGPDGSVGVRATSAGGGTATPSARRAAHPAGAAHRRAHTAGRASAGIGGPAARAAEAAGTAVSSAGRAARAGGSQRQTTTGGPVAASPAAGAAAGPTTRGSTGWPGLLGRPAAGSPAGQARRIDCSKAKCIALTFDDGPVPDTARLLRTLEARGVRVTFFVVGSNVAARPEMVRREAAAGNEVGDHSYTHPDLRSLSTAAIRSQLARTQTAVRRATGVPPVLMRPPYGATDGRVASVARSFGMPQILWSVDTLDWRDRDPAIVERRAVAGARRGGIILMHDIHPTTVSAVPRIIHRLAAKGFTFVTVSELLDRGTVRPGARYSSH